MAPEVLSRVCHGTHQSTRNPDMAVRPAILHSYRRHKVVDADYPAILPHTSSPSSVRGTVVSGLTDGDMWRLDIFEGDEYERRRVKVRALTTVGDESGKGNVEGEEVECETYVWIAGEELLEDEEWDFGEFVREKMHRWAGIEGEKEYKEVDEAVRQAEKDPTGGRGLNGHIGLAVEASREEAREALTSAV